MAIFDPGDTAPEFNQWGWIWKNIDINDNVPFAVTRDFGPCTLFEGPVRFDNESIGHYATFNQTDFIPNEDWCRACKFVHDIVLPGTPYYFQGLMIGKHWAPNTEDREVDWNNSIIIRYVRVLEIIQCKMVVNGVIITNIQVPIPNQTPNIHWYRMNRVGNTIHCYYALSKPVVEEDWIEFATSSPSWLTEELEIGLVGYTRYQEEYSGFYSILDEYGNWSEEEEEIEQGPLVVGGANPFWNLGGP